MEPYFIAPNQNLENYIVTFCQDTLKIPFGDFWYEWFNHNKSGNHSLHIQTLEPINDVWAQLSKLLFIEKIYSKNEISEEILKKHDHDFNHIYRIHFKIKEINHV